MENFDIWNYFVRVSDAADMKTAKCRICHNVFNYTSTIGNLKLHLRKKHLDEIPGLTAITYKKNETPYIRSSAVNQWKYFTKITGDDKVATCKICDNNYSYKSSSGNLKRHLLLKHPDTLIKHIGFADDSSDSETSIHTDPDAQYFDHASAIDVPGPGASPKSADEDSNDPDYKPDETTGNSDDEDSKEPAAAEELATSDLFRFFTKENDKRARCDICNITLPLQIKSLQIHLNEKHKLQVSVEQEQGESQNAYQEVVYVLDADTAEAKKEFRPRIEPRRQTFPIKREVRERERRVVEVESKKRKYPPSTEDEEDEELNNFLKYAGVLMKNLPKEVNTKMQMDIINLIMTAKINHNTKAAPASELNGRQAQGQETINHHIVVSLENEASKAEMTANGADISEKCEN